MIGDATFGWMAKMLVDVRTAVEEGKLELDDVAREIGEGPTVTIGDLDMAIIRAMAKVRLGQRDIVTITGLGEIKSLAERLGLHGQQEGS